MEEIVIKAGQLLLSLSILVILHELGHYIPAKLFKTRVEKFYLFFDPWFSIFKRKVGDTEYGVGWLPLGGYVKISGMIDESMDKEQMKKPPQPWEFRSKPAWQRLIIMLGGVTVNVILAFVIYSFSLVIWGEKYLPSEKATYGIHCDSLALAAGFQDGDIIYSIDGSKVERFARENGGLHQEMIQKLILDDAKIITVVRNGKQLDVPFTEEVKNAGGLAIIGTERHDSRRVDRQLRGRSGRQGDPGSSQFFVSLEDNLMRLFGSDRVAKVMDRMGLEEGEVIQHSMMTKSIERAQKKVEENNFGIRKRLLEYDDVMSSQREVIYKRRRHALQGSRLKFDVLNMLYDTCEEIVLKNKELNDFKSFEFEIISSFSMTSPGVIRPIFINGLSEEWKRKLSR